MPIIITMNAFNNLKWLSHHDTYGFVTIQSHNLSITWQVLKHESFRLHSLVVCMQFIDMILPKWILLIASLLHIKMFIRICLLKMLTDRWHWLSSPLRRLSRISPPPSFRWHLQCRCFRFCLNNKPYWYVLVSNLLLTNVMYVAVVLRFTYLCRMLLTRPRVNL